MFEKTSYTICLQTSSQSKPIVNIKAFTICRKRRHLIRILFALFSTEWTHFSKIATKLLGNNIPQMIRVQPKYYFNLKAFEIRNVKDVVAR